MPEPFENTYKIGKILEAVMRTLGPDLASDIEKGITLWHFMVMKLLHHEDRSIAGLAKHLEITPEAVSSIMRHMDQAGWIIKTGYELEPRVAKFSLTDKGVITFKKCWETRDNLVNKFLLDEADQAKLIEILSKILKIEHR